MEFSQNGVAKYNIGPLSRRGGVENTQSTKYANVCKFSVLAGKRGTMQS